MKLQQTCFKVDRPNGKAMIRGFRKDGKVHRQSIWLTDKDKHFPALLTLQRRPTPFKVGPIGRAMDPENFPMPFKYVVDLHSEYFPRNEMSLWRTVCSNGLFDIWEPEQPHLRFAKSKRDPAKFRIQLLRIYEIDREFNDNDIKHTTPRIDHLISDIREVTIKAPVIPDDEFADLKRVLEQSVEQYLTRRPRLVPSLTLAEPVTDLRAPEDIASLDLKEESEGHGGDAPLTSTSEPVISDIPPQYPSPDRTLTPVERIVRDVGIVGELKRLYGYRCQMCGTRLELSSGFYCEAHHLKPLGAPHNGPDVKANIILVCPNHHVLLDYGAMRIDIGTLHVNHHLTSNEFVNYHNQYVRGNSEQTVPPNRR
jgi:hypothetical protein